ncbi:endoribonuclease YbeY [Paenibacillus sp. J31TS4]|uniref:rRNA maturation RNase YbeY n=1 Tax=Paenibacillus sp. J31TS4 TaxID=2807195 RepID=UPI001B07C6F7|nr:rRNA maturation RNase YbeY [Paenibacillus sp. J31TS4]GIP39615.1 endoribonuclease YbeY [Paenibacillus sp. J31TS4]
MALVLEWTNEQEAREISDTLINQLQQLLQIAGREEQIELGEVTLTFVNNDQIQELNRNYRGMDKPTDVLSFPMREEGADEMKILYGDLETISDDEDVMEGWFGEEQIGDIVISIPKAIEQAEEYGHSFEREVGFLFVHGFLHLIGYDHQTEEDEARMTEKQEKVLQEAGLTR